MGKSIRHTMILGTRRDRSEKKAKRNLHRRERMLGRTRLAESIRVGEEGMEVRTDAREIRARTPMPKAGKNFISPMQMREQAREVARGNPDDAKAEDRYIHKLLAK